MNKTLVSALVASAFLVGCGTLSKVDSEGYTKEPIFPEMPENELKKGAFPNVNNVRMVESNLARDDGGLSRDQIYYLLDRPHFSEGFQVHEWDYLFHFNTNEGVITCQYKLLYDKNKIARSSHWKPESCRDLVDGEPAEPRPFSLSGDVAFEFDSATLTAAGNQEIAKIAEYLKSISTIEQVTVAGHTDRLGSASYNQRLSQKRAIAVKQALVAQGIYASSVQAHGYGSTQPVTTGCSQQIRDELIACLAPDRRVDITVQAKH